MLMWSKNTNKKKGKAKIDSDWQIKTVSNNHYKRWLIILLQQQQQQQQQTLV